MSRRRRPATEAARPVLPAAALLFVLALLLRLLFWQATSDRSLPYGVAFKGDAATWVEWATALQEGRPFELGLPLRPPGTAYLIAGLWDGTQAGLRALRLLWCALGALAVALFYVAFRRGFGETPGQLAGLFCAGSTALLLLAGSLDSETPYLVLLAASFVLWPALGGGGAPALAGWGALHGLACLLRVEHALCFALLLGWLLVAEWRGKGGAAVARRAALVLLPFLLALLPWHLHAWRRVAEFNHGAETLRDPAAEAAVAGIERSLAWLEWSEGAQRERQRLPAAVRRQTAAFVAATVAVRGEGRVTTGSFAALDEAFGYRPRALAPRPFVALYGPLNFALANDARSGGGFSTASLAAPPPLFGGAVRYPRALVAGLPPPGLALSYPPHLRLVNEGYEIGLAAIRQEPVTWLRLAGRKLAIFWQGASLGMSGWGVPLGLSGLRRGVDLAVPQGWPAAAWRLAVLALAATGLWRTRGRRELAPWLLYAGSKLVVAVAFFGYARQGALVAPVVLLLAALAIAPYLPDEPRRQRRLLAVAALALLLLEGARWLAGPRLRIDGRAVDGREPFGFEDHEPRRLAVELDGR